MSLFFVLQEKPMDTCSANRISRLINLQIEYIIDQVNSKTGNIVNDQSHGTKNSPSPLGILDEDDDIKIFDDEPVNNVEDIKIFDGNSQNETSASSYNSDSDSVYDESIEQLYDELTRKEMTRLKALEANSRG